MTKTNSSPKRYFVFSKSAFAKTGNLRPLRRAASREEARVHKDGNVNYGIWDTQRNMAVR